MRSKNQSNLFPEVLTTSRFYVELVLDGSASVDAYFMECKGLKYTQEVIEACEVTPQRWGRSTAPGRIVRTKIPGGHKVGNLTLKRGMTNSLSFWTWIESVQNGNWRDQCKDGSLVIYRQDGTQGARFQFLRAFPVSYNFAGSNVTANELAIEELELAIEEFKRVS
ncbi:phage tail protein [Leptolyngbya sp. AN03gr2]|uniref:phage tail protein n=1 Tax=unclassified Leptolyngbya TaxID=2650499 RepID=UPI003D31DEFC